MRVPHCVVVSRRRRRRRHNCVTKQIFYLLRSRDNESYLFCLWHKFCLCCARWPEFVCEHERPVCAVCVFTLSVIIISYCLLIYWFRWYAIVRVPASFDMLWLWLHTRFLFHISKPIKLIETIRAHTDYYYESESKKKRCECVRVKARAHMCVCAE